MTDPVFLDTNILVAAATTGLPWHSPVQACLKDLARQKRPTWISRQVLREYAATQTRPQSYSPAFPAGTIAKHLEDLEAAFRVAEENDVSARQWTAFVRDGRAAGKQVHDANIVAVMLAHKVKHLLTLNVKDFHRFEDVIHIQSPLEA